MLNVGTFLFFYNNGNSNSNMVFVSAYNSNIIIIKIINNIINNILY